MQDKKRRTNADRTDATRAALIKAARKLFVSNGFAATSTPQIVSAADVTRGALYHHFKDKADLFRAVLEAEAKAVSAKIASDSYPDDPVEALILGATTYFDAMAKPGRSRLLLVEAPVVLSGDDVQSLNKLTGFDELRIALQSLADAMPTPFPVDAAATLLSAMFDSAALAVTQGANLEDYKDAMTRLLSGLVKST